MKRLIYIATVLWVSIALTSCSRKEFAPIRHDSVDSQIMRDIKDYLPGTICVFDPDEFFPPATKADFGLPVNIQSSSLDLDNASTLSNSLYDYVQIPVHATTPLDSASVRFPLLPDGRTPSETAASKVFLIVQTFRDSAWTAAYTVTIVPHPDYMTQGQLDSLDFFYDGFFNAVFIYADLQGTVRKIETYVQGILWRTGVIGKAVSMPDDSAAVTAEGDTIISSISAHRCIIYDDMPEVVITADRGDYDWTVFESDDPGHPSNQDGTQPKPSVDHWDRPNGGGGKKQQTLRVLIAKDGRGDVSGGGEYSAYETVTCSASPHMAGDIRTSEFIQWTGDINSSSQTLTFSAGDYLLRGQVSLTAVFHDLNPCADEENDRRDPLRQMRIQASGAGGWNIKGGTFGWTRNGGSTRHKGMDFACPVGTPVFATHDGIVRAIRNDVLPSDKSFEGYKKRGGEDCSEDWIFNAGNAVEIECYTNGGLYTIKYYHLTSVEGTLYIGKQVEAGDIIGYSGITGNGGSKSSGGPHLHYQVEQNGKYINPVDFIYSVFDKNWKLINPCN